MLPLIIIASVAGSAVGAQIHKENERRKALGLPPLITPAQSTKEQLDREREDRQCERMLWTWIIVSGLIFTAPFAAMIYAALKLSFAAQGVEWP